MTGVRRRVAAALARWRLRRLFGRIAAHPGYTLVDSLAARADRWHDRIAFASPSGGPHAGRIAWGALFAASQRVTRWAGQQGLGRGARVGLMTPDPAATAILALGLMRAGIVPVLYDSPAAGPELAAAIDRTAPALLVVGADAAAGFEAAVSDLTHFCPVWRLGPDPGNYPSLDEALAALSDRPLTPRDLPRLSIDDPAIVLAGADGAILTASTFSHGALRAGIEGAALTASATGTAWQSDAGGRETGGSGTDRAGPAAPLRLLGSLAAMVSGATLAGDASPGVPALGPTVVRIAGEFAARRPT
ncbi:AMP-binding protein [Prosthecodimorpha staleyi]|uniref:AMP-binding protein n=1 Tax=Prosthecodimorpha staleyi TaxID=2840188 RepID=A0A947DA11_9HYPH|nr:AMP-binding protein [Prosthecodimorpha staleyi]MBT9291082.1 AMP-binding protein [Prosthecodimorpha staleyi]